MTRHPGVRRTLRLVFRLGSLQSVTVAAQWQILTAFPIYFPRHRHRLPRGLCGQIHPQLPRIISHSPPVSKAKIGQIPRKFHRNVRRFLLA